MRHIEYFNVKTAQIEIAVEKYTANNKQFVKTEEFREFPSIGHPDLLEWRNDTAFLCKELSKTELDLEDYFHTLRSICMRHISQFGRLIDSDLYNYIDEMLLICKALFEIFGDKYPIDGGRSFWRDLQHDIFNELTEHIWIHKFNISKPTELLRLTDFPFPPAQ